MSNKNRVNPDHYKVAGRDAQGENFTQELYRQRFGREAARLRDGQRTNFIPGAAPVGEAPANGAKGSAGMGMQASAKRGVKSTAQKQGSSRHGTAPSPQTAPVPGAFGKERAPAPAKRRRSARPAGTATRRGTTAKKAAPKATRARKTVGKKAAAGKAGSTRRPARSR